MEKIEEVTWEISGKRILLFTSDGKTLFRIRPDTTPEININLYLDRDPLVRVVSCP